MAGKIAFFALLLLSSASTLSAWLWNDPLFFTPQVISCNRTTSDLGWIGLSFFAVALGAIFSAGIWVLSGAFGTPKYQTYAKNHVWGLAETAVLLTILIAAFWGLKDYGEANILTARAYAVVIRNTVMTNFAMVLSTNTLVSFYTNVNPQFKPFGLKLGLYITFQIAPMFRPIFDTLGLLMQLMTTAILEWFAHDFMLCFVKDSMLISLLPAGMFMRTFGLKGGGNALIGIALAFYFVYPFMLVQAGEIITRHVQNEIIPVGQAPPHAWGSSCIYRPICCLGDWRVNSMTDPHEVYLENGDPSTSNGRVSAEKVVGGPIQITLDGTPATGIGIGGTCIYNTFLGRAYTGLESSISGLETWSITKALGAGVATYFIMKLLNLSFVSFALAMPSVAFTQIAVYESVYFLFIVSMVMPIFNIFITLTMAKEITKVLGTEIDLSALEKLI